MSLPSNESALVDIIFKLTGNMSEGFILADSEGTGQKALSLCDRINVVEDGYGAKRIIKRNIERSYLQRIMSTTPIDSNFYLSKWKSINTEEKHTLKHVGSLIKILVEMLKDRHPNCSSVEVTTPNGVCAWVWILDHYDPLYRHKPSTGASLEDAVDIFFVPHALTNHYLTRGMLRLSPTPQPVSPNIIVSNKLILNKIIDVTTATANQVETQILGREGILNILQTGIKSIGDKLDSFSPKTIPALTGEETPTSTMNMGPRSKKSRWTRKRQRTIKIIVPETPMEAGPRLLPTDVERPDVSPILPAICTGCGQTLADTLPHDCSEGPRKRLRISPREGTGTWPPSDPSDSE